MTPDLLPCPFCGGEAIYDEPHPDDGDYVHEVGCETIGCRILPKSVQVSEECAVATWNTRADITPHHAAQLLLSYLEKDNDKRQSIDPSGHCVKLIHGLRAIAEENK